MDNQRIPPLHKYIFGGVKEVLRRELDLNVNITTRTDVQDVLKHAKPTERQGRFGAIRLRSVSSELSPPADGFGTAAHIRPSALIKTRPRSHNIDGGNAILDFRLISARFNFEFWFATFDYDEYLEFFIDWVFAGQQTRLNFNLVYLGHTLAISVAPSYEIDIPDKNEVGTDSGLFIWEGAQLTVDGYINHTKDVRDVSVIPTIKETDLDITVDTEQE